MPVASGLGDTHVALRNPDGGKGCGGALQVDFGAVFSRVELKSNKKI
jgi:hypothetical protein